MSRNGHIAELRSHVGTRRLLVPSVSVVIADERDRLLLLLHRDGQRWGTPGGAVEPGERPSDAAVREAWEETGLHIEPTAIIGVFGGPDHELTYDNGDVTAYVSTAFTARVVGGTLRPDGDEVSDACWIEAAERHRYEVAPLIDEILDAAFAYLRAPRGPAYFAAASWVPPAG